MYDEFRCNRLFGRFIHKTVIVPNPLRNLSDTEIIPIFNKNGSKFQQSNKLIIYPSGYYPHKNFEGLVEAILSESDRYVQAGFKFVFCVDALVDLSRPIGGIEKFGDLSTLFPDLFFIVGRVSPQELNYLYANSRAGVFPSENETYGNGLYEMEALGLPFLYNATLPFHPTPSNSYASASQFEKGLLFDQIQQLVSIDKKKTVYPNASISQMDWLNKLFGGLV
jgi:glycosyltransferase involved in cell wall biosynthesis